MGSNMMGAILEDEEIFASREVHHVGAVNLSFILSIVYFVILLHGIRLLL